MRNTQYFFVYNKIKRIILNELIFGNKLSQISFLRKLLRFLIHQTICKILFIFPIKYISYLIKILLHFQKLKSIIENHKDVQATIIYAPTIDWNYLFQRPQQIALAFGKLNYLYFYCTNNTNEDFIFGFKQIADNVYITNQNNLLMNNITLFKNPFIYISSAINKKYINDYKIPMSQVIYDYIDELDVFSQYNEQIVEYHESLVKESAIVIATADKLYQEISKVRSNCLLSPNAVNPNDFTQPNNNIIPQDIKSIINSGRKIIGYYGAMACWVDYELILYLAKSCPDYEFVFIGPNYDGSKDSYLLEKNINITCLGSKSYQELSNYAHHFDVAIIPFLINKITESTSPVKLFEYMALKKPIVTTALPECKKYKCVIISYTYEEFAKNIDYALTLKDNEHYLKIIDSDIKNNTWENRVKDIALLIENEII